MREMPTGVQLVPSILDSDLATLGATLETLDASGIEVVHLDVMDGSFVPNISIGIPVVASARQHTDAFLDVHLMITQPERYVEQFVEAGADLVTVHAEATPHIHRAIQQIKQAGGRAGIALNPGTPVRAVVDLLGDVDLVLIMSVNPGFGGQSFIERSLHRLDELRHMLTGMEHAPVIEVDGGVNVATARSVVEAGAEWLVAGSAIFKHDDGPENGIRNLRQAISS